jgi:hypothetical protein
VAANDRILFETKWVPRLFRFSGPNRPGMLGMHRKRTAFRAAHEKGGTTCPCCDQHAEVYKRRIYKRMAKAMLWLVEEFERTGDFVKLKDGPLFRGGDNAKLVYWALAQTKPRRSVETHKRNSGEWMPTGLGIQFVKGHTSIPEYVYIYNGRVVGYSESLVSITDCLEGDFNYEDIDGSE